MLQQHRNRVRAKKTDKELFKFKSKKIYTGINYSTSDYISELCKHVCQEMQYTGRNDGVK